MSLLLAATLLIVGGCRRGPSAETQPATSSASTAADSTGERPNIIFIITDDQAPHTTGYEGNTHIRTPNIDRLAAEGMVFSRAYVPLPQCAPSRAAMLTGYYPHMHGPMSNDEAVIAPGVPTLANVLGGRGYRCGLVGKWHLGDPITKQAGFNDFWVNIDKESMDRSNKYARPLIVANGKTVRHEKFLTDVLTDYAIEFMDQKDKRPFFLWLAYHAPHTPLEARPDHPYDPADVPLAESINDDMSTKPRAQSMGLPHRAFLSLGEAGLRANEAMYYSMISGIDANVGRLIAHLRETGRERDTLVIFVSDNGWLLGEHQMYGKGASFYEELVRMPLILWRPGVVPAGRTSDALVSTLDLFPTAAARAGASVAADVAGADLWPLVDGTRDSLRDELFLEYKEKGSSGQSNPMLGVVTRQYKYSRYIGSREEELYDLAGDPLEMRNLASDARGAAALSDLRARVDRFQATIQTPFWN